MQLKKIKLELRNKDLIKTDRIHYFLCLVLFFMFSCNEGDFKSDCDSTTDLKLEYEFCNETLNVTTCGKYNLYKPLEKNGYVCKDTTLHIKFDADKKIQFINLMVFPKDYQQRFCSDIINLNDTIKPKIFRCEINDVFFENKPNCMFLKFSSTVFISNYKTKIIVTDSIRFKLIEKYI